MTLIYVLIITLHCNSGNEYKFNYEVDSYDKAVKIRRESLGTFDGFCTTSDIKIEEKVRW